MDPIFRLANNADGDHNNPAAAAAAALEAGDRQSLETIDFFAAESERIPARRPPSPVHREAGLEVFTINSASTSSCTPSAPVMRDDDREQKRQMAVLRAELRRINEDNKRLLRTINEMYVLLQQTRRSSSSSSSSSTPPPDALNVLWPPRILDLLQPPSSNFVPEPSNAAALRGRGEVGPADDGGMTETKRKGKEVVVYAAAPNDSEEFSEDDDRQHRDGRNSNKKLKLSSPPEPDEKAVAVRKPRVIVRIRIESEDLKDVVKIDGCQWRKYGQKNNKSTTPRCYYRCSMANQCPVRKHLQRRAEDELTVDVTYQGAHNHPLPQEAVPMARAKAAALDMVMSWSMPYGDAPMDTSVLAATMPPGARAPRTATVSTMSPFPTALLDLSKSPEPARFHGQPPGVPFPAAALPDAAAPGLPPHLLHMSLDVLATAFADFLRGSGAGGGGTH